MYVTDNEDIPSPPPPEFRCDRERLGRAPGVVRALYTIK